MRVKDLRDVRAKRGWTATKQPQVSEEVQAWADKPHVRTWLRLEPPLGEVDLGPYFTYSRDKYNQHYLEILGITGQLAENPKGTIDNLGQCPSQVWKSRPT